MGGGASRHQQDDEAAAAFIINKIEPEEVLSPFQPFFPNLQDQQSSDQESSKRIITPRKQEQQIVTPRREEFFRDSRPYTPKGEEAHMYPYYCPLCMEFFRDILRSQCCGNYSCLRCVVEYLKTKGFIFNTASEIVTESLNLERVWCPHCQTLGFSPLPVLLDGDVRDYSLSNDTSVSVLSSPIRIGDSFDDLKRKIIRFGGKADVAPITISQVDSMLTYCLEVSPRCDDDEELFVSTQLQRNNIDFNADFETCLCAENVVDDIMSSIVSTFADRMFHHKYVDDGLLND